jgi:hypothetical protein
MELELNNETLSLGQRLSRIFTSPSSVFADLERNHSWLAALLTISAISLAATVPLLSKIKAYGLIQLQQLPDNPALASPQALETTAQVTVVAAIASAVLIPVFFALLMALLLKFFNAFAGDKVPYRKLFSVCVYAYLPILLSSLIGLGLGLATPVESFGNVSTSLYLLFPPDSHSFAAMMASHVDPFMLWSLYLTALGGAALMKSKVKNVSLYIFLLWLVYSLSTSYYSALKMSTMI